MSRQLALTAVEDVAVLTLTTPNRLARRVFAAMAACLTIVTSSAAAQSAPSTAGITTKDFQWLVGHWRGQLAGSTAVADLTLMPPKAGVITGVMRLVDGSKVLVIELIAMADSPRGVEMRFRHFATDLTAYEPTFKQAMVLTSHDTTRSTFQNTVPYDKALMSTQPRTSAWIRHSPDEFVAHSDIIGDDGKPATIEVVYRRVDEGR